MSTVPELKTRRPTGKPPWPMILLAGAEKCGKSYSAAAFSASDLIDRTFWIEIGEGAADQYGALPGARYEIVEHDGTYKSIGRAIRAATMQPRGEDGKPHAIVVDSMTELWDLLSDEAQAAANRRKGKGDDGEAQITMDLWNTAKKRWRAVIDVLRTYDGPVILTSRLEQVAVMTPNGQPTTAKTLKVRSEKNLPFEVDAIVQIPEPQKYQLTGVRSVHWNRAPGEAVDFPGFTVDALLRRLGLDAVGATSARTYVAPRGEVPTEGQPQHDVAEAVARKAQQQREVVDIAPHGQVNPFDPDFDLPPTLGTASSRPATNAQLGKIAILVGEKRGISGRSEQARTGRLAVISSLIKREITSGSDLTLREAQEVIDSLTLEPPHVADAEIVPDEPTETEQLAADFESAIDEVESAPELDALVATVDGAVEAGNLTQDQGTVLLAKARQRRAGWSHQVMAERGLAA